MDTLLTRYFASVDQAVIADNPKRNDGRFFQSCSVEVGAKYKTVKKHRTYLPYTCLAVSQDKVRGHVRACRRKMTTS